MIELPDDPPPNGALPRLIDFGFVQRPPSGAAATRIDRPGNRFAVDFTFAPMPMASARVFIARINKAKREGLRLEWPLLGVNQGDPGAPVAVAAGSGGTVLNLSGLTAYHTIKEGYWLTLVSGGVHYLHLVRENAAAASGGTVTLAVEPPLRVFPADGDEVKLKHPTIEGLVTSDVSWPLAPGGLVALGFTLEEAA